MREKILKRCFFSFFLISMLFSFVLVLFLVSTNGLFLNSMLGAMRLQKYRVLSLVKKEDPYIDYEFYNKSIGSFIFSGSPEIIGEKYSKTFESEIINLYNIYKKRYKALSENEKSTIDTKIKKIKIMLNQISPRYYSILSSISKNLHLSLDLIIFQNFVSIERENGIKSCGVVSFLSNEGFLIGSNRDVGFTNSQVRSFFIFENGDGYFFETPPGFLLSGAGINSNGLCIFGGSAGDYYSLLDDGLPPSVWIHLLINKETTYEAVELLKKLDKCGGANLIIGDSNGSINQLEVYGNYISSIDPLDGIFIATNHYKSTEFDKFNPRRTDLDFELEFNSRQRVEYAKLIINHMGKSMDSMIMLLRKAGSNGAWGRTSYTPDRGYTTISYIYNLKNKTLIIYPHNPVISDKKFEIIIDNVFKK